MALLLDRGRRSRLQRAPERRAEALVELAELGLADDDGARTGSGRAPASSAERYQVHVELTPTAAHLRGGPGLREATVERLTCDASLTLHGAGEDGVADEGGGARAAGRRTRVVSGPLRRVLERRDQGCRFPGCTHTRFVDAHHVHHWSRGGTTTLDNLLLLCQRHHRAVHELGFRIDAEQPPKGATRFRFFTPDGAELPPVADDLRVGAVVALVDRVTAETPPDPGALAPRLPQSRPDYGHINWVLTQFVPRE